MRKAKKVLLPITLVIAVSLAFFSFTNPGKRYFEIAKNLDIFATLFKEVNVLYVDEINPNKVIKVGIDAMLQSLDPYTVYIPEDDIEDFRTQSTGQYGGIGAVTTRINGSVRVIMLMEGYSAQKNGLKIGDEIIKIGNIDITGLSREQTNDLMKGQASTSVSLTVKRYGESNPLKLDFTREKVKVKNVPYYGMASEDVGYLKLTEFTMQAGKEVKNAVTDLKKSGAKKIIIDLRDNPGGLLIEAVNIVNVFIPKGKEVVSTKGKVTENNATYKTLNNPVDTEIPLAILVSRGSASASEIVAGSIQDYDRGVIIGEKSFGKGLVQIPRPLSYNSQLKVTTAKYYTPSGRCIQALDYSNRNPDGSVGKVADSLKKEFRTTNNRIVFDGGGVDPDIIVGQEALSPVAYALASKGFIFDYATKFYYENRTQDIKSFKLSDNEYSKFKEWMSTKEFDYTTRVENDIAKLEKHAENKKYYTQIQEHIEDLKTTISASKQNDLDNFKSQIKRLLEQEISTRYHLQQGAVESSFDSDLDILKAIEILGNNQEYNSILAGK